jgi:hypothetical protein
MAQKKFLSLAGGVIAAVFASAAVLAVASTASANTATIGSDLTATSDNDSCLTPCIAVQQSQTGGSSPNPLTSPANGIVTQWAIRSTDNVTYGFRILRPAGANTYTSVVTALGEDPGTGDAVLTYPVSLPIRRGDAVGIGPVAGDSDAGVPEHDTSNSNVIAYNLTGQADGATAGFTPTLGHELLLQATVRFCAVPNVRKRKKVAAKKALAAADCGVKVKKKKTHKKKLRGRVLKQKKRAGLTFPPGTVVPIVIGKK